MTKRFIDFIQNKDAASFQEAFEESVSQKVYAVLEAAKKEVAQKVFNEGGGFSGVVTHGNITKGWPAPPKPGTAHDTGSKEHPAKHGEKVQTKFQKDHHDDAAHMDAAHADAAKHHHQHHMEEGHDKHVKKHGKLHHKMAKKMMKHAHKHAKKHHEEE